MMNMADLPDDVAALKASVVAVHARNERLEQLVAAFRQAMFGRKSERLDPDQFELALEDIETGIATIKAEEEACKLTPKPTTASPRVANRGFLPKHLPRVEEVIEPEASLCGCGGGLHKIGEDVSERLDMIPAQFRVIVTRRPKYACRSCSNGVVQASAPARLILSGMPTEATVAHVLPLGDCFAFACRATGLQICRSSAALPAGADLQPSGCRSGSLNLSRLGRQGRL